MAFGVIFLGAAIVIPQITMPFNGMLQGFMGDMDIDITEKKTQDILNQGKDLSMDIEREGAVLLKNENETLPLAKDVTRSMYLAGLLHSGLEWLWLWTDYKY